LDVRVLAGVWPEFRLDRRELRIEVVDHAEKG